MKSNELYTTDVDYPSIFIRNQTPILMSAIAALNGFNHHFPATGFTYCDFGCGNGLTLCLLAASNPKSDFYGVDINANHIAKARNLAEFAGLKNISFIEADFDSLNEVDLPPLDYAAVAGILSWLRDGTRTTLLKYISEKLKPGGLCYLHYLSMPGASKTLATTKVIQQLANQYEGESPARAVRAVTELQKLFGGNGVLPFNKMLPQINETLGRQRKMDPNYLAHDVLNRNPNPTWFHQLVQELSPIGLDYIGHAQPKLNSVDALYPPVISDPYIDFSKRHKDVTVREEVVGLLLNLPIRMDIFGKKLNKLEADQPSNFKGLFLHDISLMQDETARKKIEKTISIEFSDSIYTRIMAAADVHDGAVDAITTDCRQEFGDQETRRAIMHLLGASRATFGRVKSQKKADIQKWNPTKLDEILLTTFLSQPGEAPLPSLTVGGCVDVGQFDRVLLAVLVTKDPQLVWNLVSRYQINLRTPDGLPINNHSMFVQVLPDILDGFKQQKLPELMRLGLLTS